PVTTTVPQPCVTRPRPAKTIITKSHSPPRRTSNHRPSPAASSFPPKVTTVKAPKVNAVKGNMSYLTEFEEINGGYIAFGGKPKCGKILSKGKIRTEKAGEENVQQYVLFPLWSSGSKDPQNTDGDATFEVKEPKFEGRKPESEVYVSPSSSAKTKKHDDKTKREAKGTSPVELSTGYRNLST
nr:hypothetical protein [Tanacetum cinerariifolium]